MWIRKIARNLSLNWIRSASYGRKLAEAQETDNETTARSVADPSVLMAGKERREDLREAMILFYLKGQACAKRPFFLSTL